MENTFLDTATRLTFTPVGNLFNFVKGLQGIEHEFTYKYLTDVCTHSNWLPRHVMAWNGERVPMQRYRQTGNIEC